MKQLVQDFCAPGVFYKPEKSLTQLVRKTFREPPADLNDNQLHQLGFSALRQLINCEAIAKELIVYGEIPHESKGNIVAPASDPTSTNSVVSVAEVASTTAEPFSGIVTNAPEVGSILVSHPLRTEDTFSSSVTLVTRVTDDHSSGIILNRDFNGTFKARLSKAERVKYGADLKYFYEMPCFSGGSERYHDHPLDFVILHELDSLATFSERIHLSSPNTAGEAVGESSVESVTKDYLYISHDFHSIGKEIAAGRVKTSDLKIVQGCTDWAERELQEQVTQHRFFPVVCPSFAARIAMQPPAPDSFEDPMHAGQWQDPTVWYSGQYAWSKMLHLLGGEYRDMARLMRIASSDEAELLFAILPTLPGFDHKIIENEEDFQDYDSNDEDDLEAAEFLASALRMHPAVFSEVVAEAVAAGEFDEPDDDEDDE
eukprot:gene9654-11346_t